ncbi:OmpA family protein [Flavobacterium sp. 3HN19-14]|uniref:OmpA family protein n=1 Tax=Flavobacterium sp. 3HN19-14 TaxID=3448133 RepID=UPI003EE18F17
MKKWYLLLVLCGNAIFAQNNFDVFFDFNKDIPNQTAMLTLKNWMSEHKKFVVTKLYGYCDSVDNSSYNKELAARRINSVLNLLKENEIAISPAIELIPLGKDFKLSKIQAENRKVTIVAQEIPKPVEIKKTEEPQKLSQQVKSAKPGDIIKLQNINFLNNSDKLVEKSKPVLDSLLCVMNENPKLKIEIQGHICCSTVGDVRDVSTLRAKAVYVFLLRKKIARTRLTFKGYGTTRPKFPIPEKNDEEEDENRRVEIKILEK